MFETEGMRGQESRRDVKRRLQRERYAAAL